MGDNGRTLRSQDDPYCLRKHMIFGYTRFHDEKTVLDWSFFAWKLILSFVLLLCTYVVMHFVNGINVK